MYSFMDHCRGSAETNTGHRSLDQDDSMVNKDCINNRLETTGVIFLARNFPACRQCPKNILGAKLKYGGIISLVEEMTR